MIKPLKSNPGGQLDPDHVIGRDKLISRLLDDLNKHGIVLTAERRMGKTTILRKIKAEAPPQIKTIWRDLEDIWTPLEFVERLIEDLEAYLKFTDQSAKKLKALVKNLSGLELNIFGVGFTLPKALESHWKNLLEQIIADVMEIIDKKEEIMVFLWDELPIMIDNIRQRQGESIAMELLDCLRSLRQTHKNLRMIYTGSIGLHHVLGKLKKAGYANSPTNDMPPMELPPLTQDDANELIIGLLQGENISFMGGNDTINVIAKEVDYIPYYIHCVISKLKDKTFVDAQVVKNLIQQEIANNAWDLSHFGKRIDTYYEESSYSLIREILDILALEEKPLKFKELMNNLQIKKEVEPEKVREILTLLRQDHYLKRNEQGEYYFYFSLIKRWWCLDRGLV